MGGGIFMIIPAGDLWNGEDAFYLVDSANSDASAPIGAKVLRSSTGCDALGGPIGFSFFKPAACTKAVLFSLHQTVVRRCRESFDEELLITV